MLKTIRIAGLFGLIMILSVWGTAQVAAQAGGTTPPQCCICFISDCCFLIPQEQCDENGQLINPDFLHTFFDSLGIESQQICSLCDRCAFNPLTPEEDAQYLTICDICVPKPFFDDFKCTVLPPDVVDEFLPPSSCRFTTRSVITPGIFAFLGSVLILGALRVRRYKKSMGVSKCNVKS